MNYVGITTDDPTKSTDGKITINGSTYTPKINDVVVYGKKEYMYRKEGNVEKWYEIGDEEAPGWNIDT